MFKNAKNIYYWSVEIKTTSIIRHIIPTIKKFQSFCARCMRFNEKVSCVKTKKVLFYFNHNAIYTLPYYYTFDPITLN